MGSPRKPDLKAGYFHINHWLLPLSWVHEYLLGRKSYFGYLEKYHTSHILVLLWQQYITVTMLGSREGLDSDQNKINIPLVTHWHNFLSFPWECTSFSLLMAHWGQSTWGPTYTHLFSLGWPSTITTRYKSPGRSQQLINKSFTSYQSDFQELTILLLWDGGHGWWIEMMSPGHLIFNNSWPTEG